MTQNRSFFIGENQGKRINGSYWPKDLYWGC